MWKAIRQLRLFEVTQLAIATETSRPAALRFTRELRRCGYISLIPRQKYRLVRNTGPKPPVLIRKTSGFLIGMWDRNEDKAYGVDGKPAPENFWPTWRPALHKQELRK